MYGSGLSANTGNEGSLPTAETPIEDVPPPAYSELGNIQEEGDGMRTNASVTGNELFEIQKSKERC